MTYLPQQDGNSNGTITKYKLYVSNDGTNFTEVASGNWNVNSMEKSIKFDIVNASHIRLEAIEGVNGFTSAEEINVFATHSKETNIQVMLDTLDYCREENFSDDAYRFLQVHLTAVGRFEKTRVGRKSRQTHEEF